MDGNACLTCARCWACNEQPLRGNWDVSANQLNIWTYKDVPLSSRVINWNTRVCEISVAIGAMRFRIKISYSSIKRSLTWNFEPFLSQPFSIARCDHSPWLFASLLVLISFVGAASVAPVLSLLAHLLFYFLGSCGLYFRATAQTLWFWKKNVHEDFNISIWATALLLRYWLWS